MVGCVAPSIVASSGSYLWRRTLRLQALIVEDNIQEKDLVDIFESESWESEVMNGNPELTVSQIQKLAKFFHLSPVAFIEYN